VGDDGTDEEQDDADCGGRPDGGGGRGDAWVVVPISGTAMPTSSPSAPTALRVARVVSHDSGTFALRHGPLNPSALARHAGLHPATITGILDRLERGGWVARERDPSDRRAVVVRALRDRNAELFRLYAGMDTAMDQLCASYGDDELQLLADFLHRTTNAGRTATDQLARD
jgi:DNA-binding MarR family transcriptional regulator